MQINKAVAAIQGDRFHPDIYGTVVFTNARNGVLVRAEIFGLPESSCGIFGFHIHDKGDCSSPDGRGFPYSGVHYNPSNKRHPCHAGDMPPLFGCNGHAFLSFLTDRFTVSEIIGKSVIIHDSRDDFTTDPSGNSGLRIACGIISSAVGRTSSKTNFRRQ